ncbi:radical SAM family heme chaperone HemW [bacterium]|nr:radical SAM family heme chaperone HemW [bacterium]
MTAFACPRPDRFALYVHVPFCVRKCPYCAFISHELRNPAEADAVVDATLREAEFYVNRPPWAGATVHSLFLGGGTPSMLAPDVVRRLLRGLRERFPFSPEAECSIEVNPGTLTDELLHAWQAAGINRVSLGVQSLGERTLKKLGRIHTAEQARQSWKKLKEAGAFDLNVDLMYSVAVENAMQEWADTLAEIASWSPDHLSAYALIVEEDTPFAAMQVRGKQVRLEDDDELEQMRLLAETMAGAGLSHYEVSNWARTGKECRHNVSYWDGGSYLSLGPAAHSFDASTRRRFWNTPDTRAWLAAVQEAGAGVGGEEILTPVQHLEERIMLTLRMVRGGLEAELAELAEQAEVNWPPRSLSRMIEEGLLERDGAVLRCSERGLYVVDAIQAQLAADLS